MALQHNMWQGAYGERLIDALCAAAGLTTSVKSLDVDGVDRGIHSPSRRARGIGYPAIEVQIKTARNPTHAGGDISYPLETAHYNQLSGTPYEDFPLPRLLFLVVVPELTESYVRLQPDGYEFRHRVYWCNIMNSGEAPEEQGSKSVRIPTRNVLTVESLIERVSAPYRVTEEESR